MKLRKKKSKKQKRNSHSSKKKYDLGLIIAFLILITSFTSALMKYNSFNEKISSEMRDEKQKTKNDLVQRKRKFKNLKEFSVNVDGVKKEISELNDKLEESLNSMPHKHNIPEMLRDFDLIGKNIGVEVSSFKPENRNESSEGSNYKAMAVDVDLSGPFTQTVLFLDRVSRLKRILKIEDLTMKSSKADKATGVIFARTKVRMKTYRFSQK